MKKTTKILAIFLAALMAFSCLGLVAFADDAGLDDDARLAAWKGDYAALIDELTDNYKWANWKYVAENNKTISNTMITYTVFYMYDDAWKNAFDNSVSVENAEAVLAALLEKYEADFGSEYLEKALDILSGIKTAAGYVEKVNDFFGGDNFLNSEEWASAMGTLGTIISVGNKTAEELALIEERYAQIMTVKMAGQDFADMLGYIAENCTYDIDKQAAANLLAEIEATDEEVVAALAAAVANDVGYDAAMTALNVAINSNQYTAIAAKVYAVAKKVANELFNAESQAVLTDVLYSTFFFETSINDYALELLADADAEASSVIAAVNMDASMRISGNTALVNLKVAQTDGWVNKVMSKLETRVVENYVIDDMKLDMIAKLLNADTIYGEASAFIEVFCPVTVAINGYTLADEEAEYLGAEGYYRSSYAEYTDEYVKVAIPFGMTAASDDLVLEADADGDVQVIIHIDGNEYAFASGSVAVTAGDVITVAGLAEIEELPAADINGAAITMSTSYVAPAAPAPTVQDVADATGEVAKDFFHSILDSIKAIFQQIVDAIKGLFGGK